MELLIAFILLTIGLIIGLAFVYTVMRRKPKKIYLSQYPQWLCLKEKPFPVKYYRERFEEYLITDGNKVISTFSPTYNEKGQMILKSYDSRSIVIAWMPFPDPQVLKMTEEK